MHSKSLSEIQPEEIELTTTRRARRFSTKYHQVQEMPKLIKQAKSLKSRLDPGNLDSFALPNYVDSALNFLYGRLSYSAVYSYFSHDHKLVAYRESYEGVWQIVCVETENLSEIARITISSDPFRVGFSPDKTYLFVFLNGHLEIWKIASRQLIWKRNYGDIFCFGNSESLSQIRTTAFYNFCYPRYDYISIYEHEHLISTDSVANETVTHFVLLTRHGFFIIDTRDIDDRVPDFSNRCFWLRPANFAWLENCINSHTISSPITVHFAVNHKLWFARLDREVLTQLSRYRPNQGLSSMVGL